MKTKGLRIELHRLSAAEIVFDITNYDVSFANAIRRILLAEVPSMAIEKIELRQNTTVMHDEFLGHRLGLIPIRADPTAFEPIIHDNEIETEKNTLIFRLDVRNSRASSENLSIYSRDLRWEPIGEQAAQFRDPIAPVDEDILIAKLAPSQSIDATLYARKGIGKDHAKYSPVAACFYRHLTTFEIEQSAAPFTGEEIEKLKICFPKGHFRFFPKREEDAEERYEIANNRLDTSSDLTFVSCPSLSKKIAIVTQENVLTFTVESVGSRPTQQLVLEALDILRGKCSRFQKLALKQRRL